MCNPIKSILIIIFLIITQFIHGEKFTGLLVPILKLFKFIENTKQGFEAFNVAFKKTS